MARMTKAEKQTAAAFREVYRDEPSIVGKTRAKYGAERATAQKRAIALAKARRAGARIPMARSTRGSGPMGAPDLRRGYRRIDA
jgi:hypothetical protein